MNFGRLPKTQKVKDAKTRFSQFIRKAGQEPEIILQHGQPVAMVSPILPATVSMSALHGLRGDFDFAALPDDWLERDRRTEIRALEG
ncbi:type II toxin-antitoxin system Phd/YefM family antitoxin [Deinococcus altitudinis]|uniref:type II toxin-antitoxin system Phd/YefM family antitoxin n=1 Tax=Deinococcus altitudinis TaxID=468914 RepID=UPI0038914E28